MRPLFTKLQKKRVRVDPETLEMLESPTRVARKAELKMAPVPGVQTFVREDSAKGLPTNLDREDQVALPLPGSATPGGAGRDIPKFEYNTPDSESNIQPRTLGVPGAEYGHPTKWDYNMPTRRSMTARVVQAYAFNQVEKFKLRGFARDINPKDLRSKGVSVPFPGRGYPHLETTGSQESAREAYMEALNGLAKPYQQRNWPGGMAEVVALVEFPDQPNDDDSGGVWVGVVNFYYSGS